MELIALGAAAALAGLVRGFSGFGTAMIFLPVAGRVLGPFEAIVALIVMDIIGPIPLIPRAWRDADKRALGWLVGAMCLTLPIGLAVLSVAPEVLFRWLVSLV
ncbi:MAG: TSUP family transporter, partial [Pseudomonadota bacterium]